MVFSSIEFLFYFLPLVLGLYVVAPAPARNSLLLVASLLFYAWGELHYVAIMAGDNRTDDHKKRNRMTKVPVV